MGNGSCSDHFESIVLLSSWKITSINLSRLEGVWNGFGQELTEYVYINFHLGSFEYHNNTEGRLQMNTSKLSEKLILSS